MGASAGSNPRRVRPPVTLQPSNDFGRILAAYAGVFIATSLARGAIIDGYRPDRWDIISALICLGGVSLIVYRPRTLTSTTPYRTPTTKGSTTTGAPANHGEKTSDARDQDLPGRSSIGW